jgi:Fe-S-cluster containining protein
MDTVPHYWLSTHLPYRCRHSGACCTARWPIPIERDRAAAVQAAIGEGRVDEPDGWCRPAPEAPLEIAGVLALRGSGACVFYRPTSPCSPGAGGCAIHPVRPSSCEHFPYVCVVDPRGVHVTLSHFCPTAAGLLFDAAGPARVVEGPPVLSGGRTPEGLDARESLPPAATEAATRLLSWEEVTAWERALVGRLLEAPGTAEPPRLAEFARARAAVPAPWTWPEAPAASVERWHALVRPSWGQWAAAIGRYLASKAHASWAMCLGEGPRDVERLVDLARTVLQIEATRACVAAGRALDRSLLTHALRRSDLLLMHLANPHRLYRAD